MKNSIVASLVFCYQGKTYTPKACIDLDNVMETTGMLPDLYEYLAIENEIGIYSYMYEIMEGNPIVFEDASGLATQCLNGDVFDIETFENLWRQNRELMVLQEIVKKHYGFSNLDQDEKLKAALIEAFKAGKAAK